MLTPRNPLSETLSLPGSILHLSSDFFYYVLDLVLEHLLTTISKNLDKFFEEFPVRLIG